MNPTFPLEFPLIFLIVLLELLFGIGFNLLVDWAHRHNLWHVSVSVIFGVAGTLSVPAVVLHSQPQMYFWQASMIFGMCFVASGVPMVWGSTRRTVKESHQRRPLPNNAMRVRDEVVMGMASAVEKIVAKEMEIAELVHVIHKWIGALKSL